MKAQRNHWLMHSLRPLLVWGTVLALGAVLSRLNVPLSWLLGAAAVTGMVSMQGYTVRLPRRLQYVAHAMVGAGVGLALTPEAGAELAMWLPVMMMAAVCGMALTMMAMPVMVRWGRVSPATAFYALLPGGVIEMATIGERYGADRTVIASLHAIRVALIVLVLPWSLAALMGGRIQVPVMNDVHALQSTWFFMLPVIIGVLGGALAKKCGVPAPFLLGAIVSVGGFSATGVFEWAFERVWDSALQETLPTAWLAGAQVVIGAALGLRFQRASLTRIPRAALVATLLLLAMMGCMALMGAAFHWMVPQSLATLVLSFSIGGMAEMMLTAKALGQNTAMVAAFQVVRAVMVNSSAGFIWRRFVRT